MNSYFACVAFLVVAAAFVTSLEIDDTIADVQQLQNALLGMGKDPAATKLLSSVTPMLKDVTGMKGKKLSAKDQKRLVSDLGGFKKTFDATQGQLPAAVLEKLAPIGMKLMEHACKIPGVSSLLDKALAGFGPLLGKLVGK